MVRTMPLIPALLPSPLIQPIHVDDCVAGLLRIVEQRPQRRIFHLAAPEPVTFTSFLRGIASKRLGKFIVLVPVPTFLLRALILLTGTVGWSPVALVKVRSLLSVPLVHSGPDLDSLALDLRPLGSGMSRSGGYRRELLSEAFGLLGYILRRRPTRRLLVSYVRAVEALRDGRAIGLPRWMLSSPSLIALLDSPRMVRSREELSWRLEAATLIAEASPMGFARFMRDGQTSAPLSAAWRMSRSLMSEIGWRLIRFLVRPAISTPPHPVSENRHA
jgi:NADH dehydrogenase